MERVKVGIIGCGAISGNYLTNAKTFPILDVHACADLEPARAAAQAEKFEVPCACSVDEMLARDDIEIIVNLTIPAAHAEVALRAVEAGKHVVSEKPLAINRKEGKQVIEAAKRKKVRVGCAPDTFLGAGHQTARKLIDEGAIGRPVAATAFMMSRGVEGWHPNPEFYYKPGGGPMFDMGPYYLTDLMQLIGPAKRVTGFTAIAIPERVIGSEPFRGKRVEVETPDHVAGNIEFENGCIGTIITSFAVVGADYWPITIYGTEGTLKVPDPNAFDGPVKLMRRGEKEFQEVPHTHTRDYGRSVGVADLAYAIRRNRPHRASGQNAYAVLDAMEGFLDAGRTGRAYKLKAKYERPAPLPPGLPLGELD